MMAPLVDTRGLVGLVGRRVHTQGPTVLRGVRAGSTIVWATPSGVVASGEYLLDTAEPRHYLYLGITTWVSNLGATALANRAFVLPEATDVYLLQRYSLSHFWPSRIPAAIAVYDYTIPAGQIEYIRAWLNALIGIPPPPRCVVLLRRVTNGCWQHDGATSGHAHRSCGWGSGPGCEGAAVEPTGTSPRYGCICWPPYAPQPTRNPGRSVRRVRNSEHLLVNRPGPCHEARRLPKATRSTQRLGCVQREVPGRGAARFGTIQRDRSVFRGPFPGCCLRPPPQRVASCGGGAQTRTNHLNAGAIS